MTVQNDNLPSSELQRIAQEMENFEAAGSVANTGTGTRREGADFETLVTTLWNELTTYLVEQGATRSTAVSAANGIWTKLTIGPRALYVPATRTFDSIQRQSRWLDLAYGVSDLVESYPGTGEASRRYAPAHGRYAGSAYTSMFDGMTTNFDGAVLLEDSGQLKEKILLEYKTAKSTKGNAIDGNAHERLSFQVMQYLEVATRYPCCSLVVIANGAFVRYRNKYHVNFHIQADRLKCFRWFSMEHMCTAVEYSRFLNGLIRWLRDGVDRSSS